MVDGHGVTLRLSQMVVKNGDLSMVQSVKKITFPKNPDPSIAWLVFLRKKTSQTSTYQVPHFLSPHVAFWNKNLSRRPVGFQTQRRLCIFSIDIQTNLSSLIL